MEPVSSSNSPLLHEKAKKAPSSKESKIDMQRGKLSREEQAAGTITKFLITKHYEKKSKEKKPQHFHSPLKHEEEADEGIYFIGPLEAPKSDISLKAVERTVNRLIRRHDRNGLRKLANILFSSPIKAGLIIQCQERARMIWALQFLLYDSSSQLADVQPIFIKAAAQWREAYLRPYADTEDAGNRLLAILDKEGHFQEGRVKAYWGDDPEAWVEISHGGGFENIIDFLEGRTQGYPLEAGGVGLQVSPVSVNRDSEYSQKAFIHFDVPAVMKGRIQAKYLKRAPNSYEAGLPYASVKHLQNVKVEPLLYFKPSISAYSSEYWKKLCEKDLGCSDWGLKIHRSQSNIEYKNTLHGLSIKELGFPSDSYLPQSKK